MFPSRHRRASRGRFAPRLTHLEDRLTPATASLAAGVLTVDYTATGTTTENVTVANDGTSITLSGDVTGPASFPTAAINKIVVQDSGGSSAQSLALNGPSAYLLNAGLQSSGVETLTIAAAVDTAGAALSLAAPGNVTINGSLTSGGGALTLVADSDGDGKGTVTIAAPVADRLARETKLTASDVGQSNEGAIVSLSGDGNTMVMNAYGATVNGNADQGAIYIFGRSGDSWVEQTKLVAPDGAQGDLFGYKVALSHDGNTLLAGASSDDTATQADQGSVYVFTRSGGVWSLQQKILSPYTGYSAFGTYTLLTADGNLAVITGLVYQRTAGVWSQVGQSSGAPESIILSSVALSADGSTLAFGSDYHKRVYLYTRVGNSFQFVQQINDLYGTQMNERFASSIALSADGRTTVIGYQEDSQYAGLVLTRTAGVWGNPQKLLAGFGTTFPYYFTVGVSADGNTAIIGATADNSNGVTASGGVYVFKRTANAWLTSQMLRPNVVGASVGWTVALSADANTVVGGGWGADPAGTAYVYDLPAAPSGVVSITGAEIALNHQVTGGVVSLATSKPGTPIRLGNSATGSMSLTTPELDKVATPDLRIGNTQSGAITIAGGGARRSNTDITLTTAGSITSLSAVMSRGGKITLNAATTISGVNPSGFGAGDNVIVISGAGPATMDAAASYLAVPAGYTGEISLGGNVGGGFGLLDVFGTLLAKPFGAASTIGDVLVQPGGTFSIGKVDSSSSVTTRTSDLVLSAGSKFAVDVATSSSLPNDRVEPWGTVNLGGATLEVNVGLNPAVGSSYLIIDRKTGDSPVQGTFAGLPEGAKFLADGHRFAITYKHVGNDVVLQKVAPAPTVTSVVFGDGTGQRSTVRRMVVTFSQPVSTSQVAAAAKLMRTGTGGTTGNVALTVIPANATTSTMTITFSGPLTEFGSLVDGLYNFTLDSSLIVTQGDNLDGDANGTPGGDYVVVGTTTNKFFRLFGDSDGSGTVDNIDILAFRAANGSQSGPPNYNPAFDFNNDGYIDNFDFVRFRQRIGMTP